MQQWTNEPQLHAPAGADLRDIMWTGEKVPEDYVDICFFKPLEKWKKEYNAARPYVLFIGEI